MAELSALPFNFRWKEPDGTFKVLTIHELVVSRSTAKYGVTLGVGCTTQLVQEGDSTRRRRR